MALLRGLVIRTVAQLLLLAARLLDVVADFVLVLQVQVSVEFLVIAFGLLWYGRFGQLTVVVTVLLIAWLEFAPADSSVLLTLGWSDLRRGNSWETAGGFQTLG